MSRFKDSWGKTKILLSQLLCIGAVFTACTDDEVFNQTTKALQVSVSTESPAESRAIIDGGYLPDGASIGVTLTAEDGSAYDGQAFTNLQYTAAGEGSAQTWSSATPASLSITAGKVIAYYPYYGGDDFNLKAVPVETASQTDYMYAKPVTGINMVSPAANLTMQHAMTDIRINVKKGTYTGTGEVTKITAKAPAFATTATMDAETGVFANVSGGGAQFVQELTGAAISSGNIVHDFLIVPDAKSTSGDVSIFVIIDGKKFAVTVPYTESFQQGFAYTYNLTLDNAALTLDGVNVSKWGVKAEVDESLQFIDDQYVVQVYIPSDNYSINHNSGRFTGSIDWGDGITEEGSFSARPKHTYSKAGYYTIICTGKIDKIDCTYSSNYNSPNICKLIHIGKDCGVTKMTQAFQKQTLLTEIVPGALDGCTEVTTFYGTFTECTNLQEIPEGLFDKCTEVTDFSRLFYDCPNLKAIPDGLFDKCTEVTSFHGAFYNCKSLTVIPEGLFDKCTEVTDFGGSSYIFEGCFENCMNIKTVPEGLFDNCTKVTSFNKLFVGCKNLTSIPAGLFDKCTEVTNFSWAFGQCTNLTTIPEGLFDYCTEVTKFEGTFEGCSSLQAIPVGLFDKCTEVTAFNNTFYGCKNLSCNIPSGLFDYCPKVTTFYATFYGCSNLTGDIPMGLFKNNTKVKDFTWTFYNCAKLTGNIPNGLFDNCPEVTSFGNTFSGCNNLTGDIPMGLFDYNIQVTSFYSTFSGCTKLQKIPEGLFDKCTIVKDFNGIFSNTAITAIPEGLFDKCTKVTDFRNTFRNTPISSIPVGLFDKCPGVLTFDYTFASTSINEIPNDLFKYNTSAAYFAGTFSYCRKLSTIPEGLFDKCTEIAYLGNEYYSSFQKGTFEGCSGLTSIPEGLFKNNLKIKSFYNTFYGCTSLENIPANLFKYTTEVTNFGGVFAECSSLQAIPEGLFDYNTKVTDFTRMFGSCKNLKSIPPGLFDKCTKITNFISAFYQCTGLLGESPYTVIQVEGVETKVHLYERANYPDMFAAPSSSNDCFYKCTGLTDYSSIPSSWL